MATFDMVIDTNPMASVMTSVSANVVGVTGAVVAMQSAVVSEEKQAAKNICENVDNGFYMLMKSQLSQKMAACSSTMSSKLLVMKKYRSDIERMKNIMQSDYNRIYRRYYKQFNSLNKALESRVHELDKVAVEVSVIYKRFSETQKDNSSGLFLCSDEANTVNVKEVQATVKNKTNKALDAMAENVSSSINYNKKVEHILKDSSVPDKLDTFVPALLTEGMSMFDKNNFISNVYLPKSVNLPNSEFISSQMQQADSNFEWREVTKSEKEQIKSQFVKEMEKQNVDERVSKEMRRLFDESVWTLPMGNAENLPQGGDE